MEITPFAPTVSAGTHVITIPAKPNKDILLFMASNAVMTINTQTADWVKLTDSIAETHVGIWRLPANKNAGLSSISIGLSVAYSMAAVVIQEYITSIDYNSIAPRLNSGNQWGTGAHTLNVPKAIAMFAGSGDGVVGGSISSMDAGTLLADSGSSSNGSGHANSRVFLVAVDNYNVVAGGITLTLDATLTAALVATRSNSGFLGYTPGTGSTVSRSKNDKILLEEGAGFTGTINDRERKRLLVKTGRVEPQKLSLNDLYKLAGERPRI